MGHNEHLSTLALGQYKYHHNHDRKYFYTILKACENEMFRFHFLIRLQLRNISPSCGVCWGFVASRNRLLFLGSFSALYTYAADTSLLASLPGMHFCSFCLCY